MELLGHYLFLSACGYLTGILCLALAVLVLHANPRSRSCRLAFLFNISVALWAFSFATMLLCKDGATGMFVSQMISFSTVLLSTFVTHFVLVQVNLENKRKKFIRHPFHTRSQKRVSTAVLPRRCYRPTHISSIVDTHLMHPLLSQGFPSGASPSPPLPP